jgi:hypothetical protein
MDAQFISRLLSCCISQFWAGEEKTAFPFSGVPGGLGVAWSAYGGPGPRTWFTLTDTGRAAFDAYLAALHEIVGPGAAQPPPPAS